MHIRQSSQHSTEGIYAQLYRFLPEKAGAGRSLLFKGENSCLENSGAQANASKLLMRGGEVFDFLSLCIIMVLIAGKKLSVNELCDMEEK